MLFSFEILRWGCENSIWKFVAASEMLIYIGLFCQLKGSRFFSYDSVFTALLHDEYNVNQIWNSFALFFLSIFHFCLRAVSFFFIVNGGELLMPGVYRVIHYRHRSFYLLVFVITHGVRNFAVDAVAYDRFMTCYWFSFSAFSNCEIQHEVGYSKCFHHLKYLSFGCIWCVNEYLLLMLRARCPRWNHRKAEPNEILVGISSESPCTCSHYFQWIYGLNTKFGIIPTEHFFRYDIFVNSIIYFQL